jgi:REP element-mobilizing transposase RayT
LGRQSQNQLSALKGQIKTTPMAQSLSKIYIHLVFHIKKASPTIRPDHKNDLYAYMGSVIKTNDSIPILINGTEDHVHILCIMSKNISLAKLTEEIKRHSSRWIKTLDPHYTKFGWQGGYAGFSVSQSLHDKTKQYIANQEEHHQKFTFKEELIMFLKEYGVEYNEEYLFED